MSKHYYKNPQQQPEYSYSTQGIYTCEVTPTTNVIYPDGRPLFFMERFTSSEPQQVKPTPSKTIEGLDAYFASPLSFKPEWMKKCK